MDEEKGYSECIFYPTERTAVRRGEPVYADAHHFPFEAKNIKITWPLKDKIITIRIPETPERIFPVSLTLPIDEARVFLAQLEEELGRM